MTQKTGAAEEQALFTYEALPRGTVLVWEVTCRNPAHFKVGGEEISAVKTPEDVHNRVQLAHPYLEHLGVGEWVPGGWVACACCILVPPNHGSQLQMGVSQEMRENLDLACAKAAQEIALDITKDGKQLYRLLMQALGVLEEQGLYALFPLP